MTSLQPNLNRCDLFPIRKEPIELMHDASLKTHYSDLDQSKINTTLYNTFCGDLYGRQIRSIVTEFLGYACDDGANSRFITLMKKCNAIVETSNKKNLTNKKVALILQTVCDETENFNNSAILPQLVELAKNHYVVLSLIGLRGETLGEAITKVAKKLNDRSITTLIIRAHGNENCIQLGHENFYSVDDVREEDFASLDPKATIIFSSCFSGCNLARKIASIQPRSVFAYIGECTEDLFTLCCSEHGYCGVAFNNQTQISRRYTFENGDVIEALPCCDTVEGVKKIKQILLHDKIEAAKSGDAVSQYKLGFSYAIGKGVLLSYTKAAKWYFKSATQGNVFAQYNLACCYYTGRGISQSYEKAVEWQLKAAIQGHLHAQHYLGVYYSKGHGISRSYKKAAEWYLLAAVQGHISAQYKLAIMYRDGQGITKSLEDALKWFEKAAEQGHVDAKHNLHLLTKKELS